MKDKIKKIFVSFNACDLTGYYLALNEIEKLSVSAEDFPQENRIKIALLSSFTVGPIADFIKVSCLRYGIYADIYVGGFNQYAQEVLDEKSALYAFKPELTFFLIDIKDELSEVFTSPFALTADEIKSRGESFLKNITDTISLYRERAPYSTVVVNDVAYAGRAGFSISDCRQEVSIEQLLRDINTALYQAACDMDSVYVFAFDGFMRKYGYDNISDPKMDYIAAMPLSEEGLMLLSLEYMRYIYAFKGMTKKCLVLDLDNTLWGGVVAEDGFDGIELGESPQGRIYTRFQQAIKNLLSKGVLLAINSKNNHDDAMQVIKEHPHMVLKEEDFSAVRINWEDKAANIVSIAQELNIGINSMVFIDDNPRERMFVKQLLPEVTVCELPSDSAGYKSFLENMIEFESLSLTQEDKNRTGMYKAQKDRESFQKSTVNMDEFIKGLDMRIEIKKAGDFEIPRAAQLFAKTNQFNLTTKRYTVDEVRDMVDSDAYRLFCVNIKDKFGDNGVSAMVLLEICPDVLRIDSFLLSCRVIGRRIEEALLAKIFKEAVRCGAKYVQGEYIETAKNVLAKDFYTKNGFVKTDDAHGCQIWRYEMDYSRNYDFPVWAHIEEV